MANQENSLGRRVDLFIHSIRFRLTLWFVIILGVVLAVFSVFIYLRQAQDIRSTAITRLNTRLLILLNTSSESDHDDEQAAFQILANNPGLVAAWLQNGEVLAVISTQGSVLQSWGALSSEDIQRLPVQSLESGNVRQVRVETGSAIGSTTYLFTGLPFKVSDNSAGMVLLGTPLDPDHQLERLLVTLILGNGLMLLIAFFGGLWLADRAMRPVHTITQAARQISETDLSKRLQLPGKDELVELANTFDDMLDRLQVAFERQRQFTADASHELRTPLTIIELETSRTLSVKRSIPEYERTLRGIQAENQLMIRMVNNLLALARMDAGQVSLQTTPLDLGEVVLEVVERLGPIANGKGVALNIEDAPQVTVQGDRQYLIQMLTNLIENGIKYTIEPDPAVNVSLEAITEGERKLACVRVSDNGPGIAAEHLPHLFDRFYQVDASRSRSIDEESHINGSSSGTGLGLSIAQWIAHAHQGEMRVSSTPGKGSTFEVILPVFEA
jgi:two-component system, OmpR family, sensor kinase